MWLWVVLIGVGLLLFYAIVVEPFLLHRRAVEWRFKEASLGEKSLDICFVSDMHAHQYGLQEWNLKRLLPRTTDLLVLGGDVAASEHGAEAAVKALSDVSASLGRFAVLGNTEHKPDSDMRGVQKVLCREGFQFLIDDWVRIPLDGIDLILAGVEDVYSQIADLEQLVNSLPEREGTLRILISHSPQIVLNPLAGAFDLVLSGHTHGGQVRLPFWGALYAHNPLGARFSRGLFMPGQLRECVAGYNQPPSLYISSGVGTGYIRVRFACRPEITLLRVWLPG